MRTLLPIRAIDLEDRKADQVFVERISLSDVGLLVEPLTGLVIRQTFVKPLRFRH